MKNIGERLSHLLKQNGMTQRELAKKVIDKFLSCHATSPFFFTGRKNP